MPGISYDRAADVYDATRGYPSGVSERIRDVLVQQTRSSKQSRFLEMGIGTGRIAVPFITLGYDYTGIDLSRRMLDRLLQKFARAPEPVPRRWQVVQGDIGRLPFANSTFDVLLTVNVLHLVDDWQVVLHEARRVLRHSRGQLVIARDSRREILNETTSSPSQVVEQQWMAILAASGVSRPSRQRRLWNQLNDEAVAALRALGANVRRMPPIDFEATELSAREAVEQIRVRAYPEEWTLPDDVHAEGIRRLETWLTHHHPSPDHRVRRIGQLEGLIATWSPPS